MRHGGGSILSSPTVRLGRRLGDRRRPSSLHRATSDRVRVDADEVEAARDDVPRGGAERRGGTPPARSRAPCGGGRSGGSRRRRGSRRSGSRAARAARVASATTAGSSSSRLTRSRSSACERLDGLQLGVLGLGVAEDPGDPRVRVLHVVDGVLGALLRGEVDVDLDRLVGAAVDEEPAGRVDADLVDQLVEEHDVAGALRHLRRLAAAGQVDELVEQHLDARPGRSRASGRSPGTTWRCCGGRRRARRWPGRYPRSSLSTR